MNVTQLQAYFTDRLQNKVTEVLQVGGGCINQTYKLQVAGKSYFCKINSISKFPGLLEKEKNGLFFIQIQNKIQTPRVVYSSNTDDHQLLLLEWIEEGIKCSHFWKTFGEELAALHHVSHNFFGLNDNNYMGNIPQNNTRQINWIHFFIEQRLQPLLIMCVDSNLLSTKHVQQFQFLYARLPGIFNDEKPALLHGDLWSGNFICNKNNQPVLIDPAVYFGHRSMDLAMTILFGGFDQTFYDSYHYHFPFPSNYKEQWKVCNLYPLLVHLVLFGKSYRPQIEETLKHFT